MISRPCLSCGAVIRSGSRCDSCRKSNERQRDRSGRTHSPKASPKARGYDQAWRRLSERARKLQLFCTDCGSTRDLQADHTPEAWARHDRGLPIRLEDIEVVCAPCNRARGAARGENVSHARRSVERTQQALGDQQGKKSRQTATQSRGGGPQQVTTPTRPRFQVSVRTDKRVI